MTTPKLIDNHRHKLVNVLKSELPDYSYLSIATGFWDLAGTAEIIDLIENYKEVRLLIGQEPLSDHLIKRLGIESLEDFPEKDITSALANDYKPEEAEKLRKTSAKISEMIKNGQLHVKVFKKPTLHAKAYILGNEKSERAVGIIGSSNFTKAGLESNAELNASETQPNFVVYPPQTDKQPHSHLSWFNELWNDPEATDWTGEFSRIISESPVGDMTFGPYDVYLKTLMEVFPEELEEPPTLGKSTEDILFNFQNRNAGLLINKMRKTGVAMLSDSVGLGKTITAGAVIKHYLTEKSEGGLGKSNIKIIVPAALKQQWEDDLELRLGLENHKDYQLISQQDSNAIEKTIEDFNKYFRRNKHVDLFVIDEAHNLRNIKNTRSQTILDLLQLHPNAHVLLLTATPINNSLLDISHQIQLASKGKLVSVNVPYLRPAAGKSHESRILETIDFFEAVGQIQNRVKKAEKKGQQFDFGDVKNTVHAGLQHYLVRSTRQGVESEGTLIDSAGNLKSFPKSDITHIEYEYHEDLEDKVQAHFDRAKRDVFEGVEITKLNLDEINTISQQTAHPLDFLKNNAELDMQLVSQNDDSKSVIEYILQAVWTLGFAIYRPEIYKIEYYNKPLSQINAYSLKNKARMKIRSAMSIHNILQVGWMKRLESSAYALKKSIENYQKRMRLFSKYLEQGYIVSLSDISLLEKDYDYGENIEQAFADYDEYIKQIENAQTQDKSQEEIKKEFKKVGIEKIHADPNHYQVQAYKNDIARDEKICSCIIEILDELLIPKNNAKLQNFIKYLQDLQKSESQKKFGKKVLVFSFFSDTIEHLQTALLNSDELKSIPEFSERSAFLTGANNRKELNLITNRFSPKSKQFLDQSGNLLDGLKEIVLLFATYVLSDGQKLQDCSVLVN
jgi:hypothetical protein